MHTLIVLLGPTGVGKTNLSLRLANHFQAPILSSDSRQFYREMQIGTAMPTYEQLQQTHHFFIGTHSIFDNYNAGQYELDVIRLLPTLFETNDFVLLVGGSMLYIDAVCEGIDDLPTIDAETRNHVQQLFQQNGLQAIRTLLKTLDPDYYDQVDLMNAQRIMHALEICLMSNRPYSSLRTKTTKRRPFCILKIGLNLHREELYQRINLRVDDMVAQGLEEEARSLFPFKHLNPLNTVGYKEFFDYFDGLCTYDVAIDKIKQHSRNYAKKQLSWFKRDSSIHWFQPHEEEAIISYIEATLTH